MRPRPYVSGRPVRRCELRTARCSGVYSEKTHWLWVRRHPSSSSNARRISGESSAPRSAHARSASLRPPQGFTPRTSGASVWRPTTTSSRVGCKYAGACEVMVHGLLASTPRHPPAAASRASSAWHAPHSAAVFSVGPASEPRRSASAELRARRRTRPRRARECREGREPGRSSGPSAAMTRGTTRGAARRTGRGAPAHVSERATDRAFDTRGDAFGASERFLGGSETAPLPTSNVLARGGTSVSASSSLLT